MKTRKLLLIFILILLFFANFKTYSQTWAPIGAKWYYNYNQASSVGYVKIECIKDTIIANDTCKVLNKTRYQYDYPGVYHTVSLGNEYIFQNGNKIYNYKYGQFYILYDFSATIGDIWTVSASRYQYSSCDTIGKVHVDSIGIKIIYPDTFKIIYTSSYQNSNWVFSGPIVEKLGCLGYMLPIQQLCDLDHEEGGSLRCYSDSLYFYQADSLIPCDFITSINEIMADDQFIKVFPNPVYDNLNISLSSKGSMNTFHQIEIYNCFGQLIRKLKFDDSMKYSDYNFNVHSLSSGIYLIRVYTSDGTFERKIIKN